jgi:hypothetical protein
MDIVERSGAYCSDFICAWPPVDFLFPLEEKMICLCTLWLVLKAGGEMTVAWSLLVKYQILPWPVNLINCSDSWLTPEIAQGDSLVIVGWLVNHYYHVQWYSLIYLLDLAVRSHWGGNGRTCQLLTFFWTFTRFGRKVMGKLVNWLLPWTYPHFLLQQEASALWNTVVINNNGILIHFS